MPPLAEAPVCWVCRDGGDDHLEQRCGCGIDGWVHASCGRQLARRAACRIDGDGIWREAHHAPCGAVVFVEHTPHLAPRVYYARLAAVLWRAEWMLLAHAGPLYVIVGHLAGLVVALHLMASPLWIAALAVAIAAPPTQPEMELRARLLRPVALLWAATLPLVPPGAAQIAVLVLCRVAVFWGYALLVDGTI